MKMPTDRVGRRNRRTLCVTGLTALTVTSCSASVTDDPPLVLQHVDDRADGAIVASIRNPTQQGRSGQILCFYVLASGFTFRAVVDIPLIAAMSTAEVDVRSAAAARQDTSGMLSGIDRCEIVE